jgi:hypothetical protein
VVLEEGSELKQIEDWAFSGVEVAKFEIPSKCQILNGLSLSVVKSFTISKENPFLVIEDSFLKSSDRKRLIWYLGSEEQVVVKKEVEVISEGCFSWKRSLKSVVFEKGSDLRRLEREAFAITSLDRIVIPASVEVIGKLCFWDTLSDHDIIYEGHVADIADDAFGFFNDGE